MEYKRNFNERILNKDNLARQSVYHYLRIHGAESLNLFYNKLILNYIHNSFVAGLLGLPDSSVGGLDLLNQEFSQVLSFLLTLKS